MGSPFCDQSDLSEVYRPAEGPNDVHAARRLTVVVFDKTGTLTVGRPDVVDLISAPGTEPSDVFSTDAAVENFSLRICAGRVQAHFRRRVAEAAALVNGGVVRRAAGLTTRRSGPYSYVILRSHAGNYAADRNRPYESCGASWSHFSDQATAARMADATVNVLPRGIGGDAARRARSRPGSAQCGSASRSCIATSIGAFSPTNLATSLDGICHNFQSMAPRR